MIDGLLARGFKGVRKSIVKVGGKGLKRLKTFKNV